MNIGELIWRIGPLVIIIVTYIVPVALGYGLLKKRNVSNGQKTIWLTLILFTSYIGFITCHICTKK